MQYVKFFLFFIFLFSLISVASATDFNTGVTHVWSLNETGSTILDSVGANDGTVTGTVRSVDGVNDKARETDYWFLWRDDIDIGPMNDINDFTISFWFHPDDSSTGHILAHDTSLAISFDTTTWGAPADTITVYKNCGASCGNAWDSSSTALTLNAWNHVLIRRESADVNISINGGAFEANRLRSSSPFGTGALGSGAETFKILQQGGFRGTNPNGIVDEIIMWDYAMTPAQKDEFYTTYIALNETYPFPPPGSFTFNSVSADNTFAITEFIGVDGKNFTLKGEPYHLMGADSYYLADYATNLTYDDDGNEITNSRQYVNEILDKAKYLNVNVIRTWMGMQGGVDSPWPQSATGGHYNLFEVNVPGNYSEEMFAAMDYVIYAASQRDIRLQLVFVNNWADYGGMSWYVNQSTTANHSLNDTNYELHDQFYTDDDCRTFYRNYVNHTLNRNNTISGILYKDDPAIFAWLLANEPRTTSTGIDHTVLTEWITNMTAYVKSIDTNHLVGAGIEGWGLNETWGEGTDMIADHNNTGVDFATFELHPNQWDYFAQRSETAVEGVWADDGPENNDTLDWWTTGGGYTFSNRYSDGNVAAYIPTLARNTYQNWVAQNVNWSNQLDMPVLLQEVAINTSYAHDMQQRFFHNAINTFFSEGGDGFMLWNLNHNNYWYSTDTNGTMDDGYSYYYANDPFLENKSLSYMDAYTFVLTNNTGGTSWVDLLSSYTNTFYYNVTADVITTVNCSLWLNVTNISDQSTGYRLDQSNTSAVVNNATNTFVKVFENTDKSVDWYISCYDSNGAEQVSSTTQTYLAELQAPIVTLTSPADEYSQNETVFTLNYTVANTVDINNCTLYIDDVVNQTTQLPARSVNQNFSVTAENITVDYEWYVSCENLGGTDGTADAITFNHHLYTCGIYSEGNWTVDATDNCVISSNIDMNNLSITISGVGTFTVQANITNVSTFMTLGSELLVNSGGIFTVGK